MTNRAIVPIYTSRWEWICILANLSLITLYVRLSHREGASGLHARRERLRVRKMPCKPLLPIDVIGLLGAYIKTVANVRVCIDITNRLFVYTLQHLVVRQ